MSDKLPGCDRSACKAARDVLMQLGKACDTDNQKLSVLGRVVAQVLVDRATASTGIINEKVLDNAGQSFIELAATLTQELVEEAKGKNPQDNNAPDELLNLLRGLFGGNVSVQVVRQPMNKKAH